MTQQYRAILRISGPDIQQDTIDISVEKFVIGRLDDNDLTLKHNKVSRHHANILLSAEGVSIEDLGSSNGTTVGDDRLEANQPRKLNEGDGVGIGPFVLILEKFIVEEDKPPEPEPAPPPPPPEPKAEAKPKRTSKKKAQEPAPAAPRPAAQPPAARSIQPPAPPDETALTVSANGQHPEPLRGLPTEASSWLEFLPAIYGDNKFFGKFLLIFESGFAPYEWIVDNFDLYLDPRMAPSEFLQWFGHWVDVMVPSNISVDRQRALALELGPIFKARGTRKSLSRHLELVFGVTPDIVEPEQEFAQFLVILPLGSEGNTTLNRDLAETIIESHRPIHTRFRLIIE